MEIPYKSFVSSIPFMIKGPCGRTFFMHSDLMAKHSRVLKKAVNSGMKESQEHILEIIDVDGDIDDGTVVRFIQYAYTGDYTVPETPDFDDEQNENTALDNEHPLTATESFGKLLKDVAAEGENQVPNDSNHSTSSGKDMTSVVEATNDESSALKSLRHRREKRSKHDHWTTGSLRGDLQKRSTEKSNASHESLAQRKQNIWSNFVSSATTKQLKAWEPRRPTPPFEDYTFDLLCHARLYVFSHRFECNDLATLALQKLRLALSRYSPDQGTSSVMELAGYTYCHTQDHEDRCDRLRKLLVEYLACHLEVIMKERDFSTLLQENRALAHDLLMVSMI